MKDVPQKKKDNPVKTKEISASEVSEVDATDEPFQGMLQNIESTKCHSIIHGSKISSFKEK